MLLPCAKFVITGAARSGTTQLANICNRHPDINCHYEPFRHSQIGKDYREGRLTIHQVLKRLYSTGEGFKECCESVDAVTRKALLALPVKIIFIERLNRLRQAVSLYLAKQTDIWQTDHGKNYDQEVQLVGEIPLEVVEFRIKMLSTTNDMMKRELQQLRKPYFHLIYEDFYFGSEESQERTTKEMFEFIGMRPVFTNRMRELFRNGRLNDEGIYQKIPNIDEIDRTFGPKHGRLLNKTMI